MAVTEPAALIRPRASLEGARLRASLALVRQERAKLLPAALLRAMPIAEAADLRLVVARRVGANLHGLLWRTLIVTSRATARAKIPSTKPDRNTAI
jgi:hypothetical protein